MSKKIRNKKVLTEKLREELVEAARQARPNAYVPYSHYQVGAALLTASGRVYTGVNIENAAYPATICAERVAVFKAVADGERQFDAIAVVTSNGGFPCGSCRQVLAEFGLEVIVLIADETGRVLHESRLEQLLPGAFVPDSLPKDSRPC
jgi:cytidine deaminase